MPSPDPAHDDPNADQRIALPYEPPPARPPTRTAVPEDGHLAASLYGAHLVGLWRTRSDSVIGVSLGPARLIVLDCDSAAHGQVTTPQSAGMIRVRDELGEEAAARARIGEALGGINTPSRIEGAA
jgi:hypothetical protein